MDKWEPIISSNTIEAFKKIAKLNSTLSMSKYHDIVNPEIIRNISQRKDLENTFNKAFYTNIAKPSMLSNSNVSHMVNQLNKTNALYSSTIKNVSSVTNVQKMYGKISNQILKSTPNIKHYIANYVASQKNLKDIVHPENQIFKNVNISKAYIKQLSSIRSSLAYKLSENFQEISQVILEANPRNKTIEQENKLFDKLIKLGWTFGMRFKNQDVLGLYDSSQQEINDTMLEYYQENNYNNLFEEMDGTVSYLYKINATGYAGQYSTVESLLQHDFENYIAIVPTLFAILSFIFDYQHHLLGKKKSAAYKNAQNFKDENGEMVNGVTFQIMRTTSAVFFNYYANVNFNFGPQKVEFGRNSVQHGRYDPSRYRKEDVIKLIVIISAMEKFE